MKKSIMCRNIKWRIISNVFSLEEQSLPVLKTKFDGQVWSGADANKCKVW